MTLLGILQLILLSFYVHIIMIIITIIIIPTAAVVVNYEFRKIQCLFNGWISGRQILPVWIRLELERVLAYTARALVFPLTSCRFTIQFYKTPIYKANLQGKFTSHTNIQVFPYYKSHVLWQTTERVGTTCTTKVPHSIPGGVEVFSARFRGKMVCGGLILTESLFLKGLKFISQKMIFI